MKAINRYLSTKIKASDIRATDKTVRKIVKGELDRLGHYADLNHIDVIEVTNMSKLFDCYHDGLGQEYYDLNPDISEWDVSNVKSMESMFLGCNNFNCDISGWDVSNVENMRCMFWYCKKFNCDISKWNVSKVKNMYSMFYGCKNFNQDLSQWDVKRVKNMENMFYNCCPIKEEFKPKFNI